MTVVSFHNTVGYTGRQLVQANVEAKRQDAVVLDVFRKAGRALTPSEVHALLPMPALLTSVRRAITNLTRDGKLVRLDMQRMGPWKRPEHVWALPAGQGELFNRAA